MSPTNSTKERTLDVLRFWQTLEAFHYEDKPGAKKEAHCSTDTAQMDTLLDNVIGNKRLNNNGAVAFVSIGKASLQDLSSLLFKLIGKPPLMESENASKTVLFSYAVYGNKKDGFMLRAPQVHPLVYAINCLSSGQSMSDIDFPRISNQCSELAQKMQGKCLGIESEIDFNALTTRAIQDIIRQLKTILGVSDDNEIIEERVYVRRASSNTGNERANPFTDTGHFSKDLDRFCRAVEKADEQSFSPGERFSLLASYANGYYSNAQELGIDLLDGENSGRPEVLRELFRPQRIPKGMWPASYSPAFMQQAAINLTSSLSGTRQASIYLSEETKKRLQTVQTDILSVNGPPGTGKTTLLKNVVADLVVKRAHAITEYTDRVRRDGQGHFFKEIPFALGEEAQSIKVDNKPVESYYAFENDAVNDLGALLCSSNNTAAQNISVDWCLLSTLASDLGMKGDSISIDDILCYYGFDSNSYERSGGVDIFAPLGGDSEPDLFFTHAANSGSDGKGKKWGLIAAVLGNSTNVNQFIAGPFSALLEDAEGTRNIDARIKSTEAFKKLYSQVTEAELAAEASATAYAIDEILTSLAEDYPQIVGLSRNDAIDFLLQVASPRVEKKLSRTFNKLLKKLLGEDAEEEPDVHLQSNGQLRDNIELVKSLRDHLKGLSPKRLSEMPGSLDYMGDQVLNRGSLINLSNEPLTDAGRAEAQQCSFTHFDGPSGTLNFNRQKLFLLGLQVIKHTFLCSSRLQTNLRVWRKTKQERLRGREYSLTIKSRYYTFQSLLFVIPIVSSTFHSVQTLFKDGPADQMLRYHDELILDERKAPFGLLIVDEAGQADPYYAAGAMARCRRAIVVGDPMQTKPIRSEGVEKLRPSMRQAYELPPSQDDSIQTLADVQNPYGSRVNDTWVGCPLLVHRRCLDPMFSISNELCYGETMINMTRPPQQGEEHYLAPSSAWFDISGSKMIGKHAVESQIDFAAELVRKHVEDRKCTTKLYVITPFNDIKMAIKKRLSEIADKSPNNKAYEPYTIDKPTADKPTFIGTVHAFQGKEAEEVILVLGCHQTCMGSADWVESDESLINVAVSRAKHRLYVIGDISLWSKTGKQLVKKFIYSKLAKEPLDAYRDWIQGKADFTAEASADSLVKMLNPGLVIRDRDGHDDLEDEFQANPFNLLKAYDEAIANPEKLLAVIGKGFGFRSKEDLNRHFKWCQSNGDSAENLARDSFCMALLNYQGIRNGREINEAVINALFSPLSKAVEQYLNGAYLRPFAAAYPHFKDGLSKNKTPAIGNYPHTLNKSCPVRIVDLTAKAVTASQSSQGISQETIREWWKSFEMDVKSFSAVRNNATHQSLSKQEYLDAVELLLFGRGGADYAPFKNFFMEEGLPQLLNDYVTVGGQTSEAGSTAPHEAKSEPTQPKPQPPTKPTGTNAKQNPRDFAEAEPEADGRSLTVVLKDAGITGLVTAKVNKFLEEQELLAESTEGWEFGSKLLGLGCRYETVTPEDGESYTKMCYSKAAADYVVSLIRSNPDNPNLKPKKK